RLADKAVSGVSFPAAAIGSPAAGAAAEALRTALQRRSLGARTAFDRLAHALGQTTDATALRALKAALDKLDYDCALDCLDQLLIAAEALKGATQSQGVLL